MHKKRISSIDRILFVKRLALYLRSGIPIVQAIDLMLEGAKNKSLIFLLSTLSHDIRRGHSLTRSLSLFPRIYNPFYLQLIEVGEVSGTLATTLTYLADILNQRAQLKRKIISALIYPAIILFGTLGLSAFLILYAFPKIIPLFKGFNAKLPLSTRLLISLSDLLRMHGVLVAACLVIFICIAWYISRISSVKARIDTCTLILPIVRKIVQDYYVATIFRLFSVLLRSGVRIDGALTLIGKSLSHSEYRASFFTFEKAIHRGERLAAHMRAFPRAYPLVAVQLISAGEMTGTLSESAKTIAEIYEEDLSEQIQRLSSLIEPVLMVCMGAVVGFVALAIITPMYALTQSLTAQ